DQVYKDMQNGGVDSLDVYSWSGKGWRLTFRPYPLAPDKRGKSHSFIAVYPDYGGVVDSWSPIRAAVIRKGSKYRGVESPLVVAVNHGSSFLEKIDEVQALLGDEAFVFSKNDEPRLIRRPNGAWTAGNGPRYTGVSGVWIFNDLHL